MQADLWLAHLWELNGSPTGERGKMLNDSMSLLAFAVVFVAGGAAIAVHLFARYPSSRPRTLRGALVHVGLGLLAAQLVLPLSAPFVAALAPPQSALVAVIGLALPVLVYACLGAIWAIAVLQDTLARRFR
jgi:hypothetical protein